MSSLNNSEKFTHKVYRLLRKRNERLVLAESCTGGNIAAVMTQIPGISDFFCGSLVTYRPFCKRYWLMVKQNTMEKYTTESRQVACEMAKGALIACGEATWSASVVGHFSPDAPHNKIYVAIARRTKKDNIKTVIEIEHYVQKNERHIQQMEATEVVLTALSRAIIQHDDKERKRR